MKKRLLNLSKLLTKKPNDPYIRGKLMTCKKEYRKILRDNKRTFEIANLNKLQSLTSKPKEFWRNLKNTLGKYKSNNGNIPPDIWVEHFSGINKKDPHVSPKINSVVNILIIILRDYVIIR